MMRMFLIICIVFTFNVSANDKTAYPEIELICNKITLLDNKIEQDLFDEDNIRLIQDLKKLKKEYNFQNTVHSYNEYILKLNKFERHNKGILIVIGDKSDILSSVLFAYLPETKMVGSRMEDFNILSIDATNYSPETEMLLDKLNVVPPSIIVGTKNSDGRWMYKKTIFTKCVGPNEFLKLLNQNE